MSAQAVGFIGLGVMGEPMSLNLLRSGTEVTVWNRSPAAIGRLKAAGAKAVSTPAELFEQTSVVLMMLANAEAIDSVLGRGTGRFVAMVKGRTVVHMGTTAPEYSSELAADVLAAGGRYVESPVSGSRKPAEDRQLVGMLAGDDAAVARVRPLVDAICRETFVCGAVPNALKMKLAVNTFLISMVAGLAEAFNFASWSGLDLIKLAAILDAGPMASSVSRAKAAKIARGDFSVQAAVADVLMNSRLIVQSAQRSRIATPLLDASLELFDETVDRGEGTLDMAAVVHALADRTRSLDPGGDGGDRQGHP